MVNLCSRVYSNYFKYHTRHDCSLKIATCSIFLELAFICFVYIEGCVMCASKPPFPSPHNPLLRTDSRISLKYCLKVQGGADVLRFPILQFFSPTPD